MKEKQTAKQHQTKATTRKPKQPLQPSTVTNKRTMLQSAKDVDEVQKAHTLEFIMACNDGIL